MHEQRHGDHRGGAENDQPSGEHGEDIDGKPVCRLFAIALDLLCEERHKGGVERAFGE